MLSLVVGARGISARAVKGAMADPEISVFCSSMSVLLLSAEAMELDLSVISFDGRFLLSLRVASDRDGFIS